MAEEIMYPSLGQVSKLHNLTIDATGGERGYLSKSNLKHLLDTVKMSVKDFPSERQS